MGREPLIFALTKRGEMKRMIRTLVAAVLLSGLAYTMHAQCEPDTEGCIDVDEPGQMCPRILPDATVNVPYEVVLTVIPPSAFEVPGIGTYEIAYITVDSVKNTPAGLDWEANADIFYADTAYCILIHGTPAEAGTRTLAITVTAYVQGPTGIIPTPPLTDDTSIVVTVQEPAGFDPSRTHEFQVMPNIPNPFSETTTLGFYTPHDELVDLVVFDILGKKVHDETQGFPPGEHRFGFTGEDLQPGTYIYRIIRSGEVHTGKVIKVRR